MGFSSLPSSSFGYWRGGMSDGPLSRGQGSGYGAPNQGAGLFPPGSGSQVGGGGWTPTVTYLLVLIAAEVVAFGLLAKALR